MKRKLRKLTMKIAVVDKYKMAEVFLTVIYSISVTIILAVILNVGNR